VIGPSAAERLVPRTEFAWRAWRPSPMPCVVWYPITQPGIPHANVNSARLILVSLIGAVPAILLVDGPIVQGLIVAVLSGGIAIIAWTLRQGEAGFLLTVIRPIAGLAIIPAVWMLFQTIPLNTGLAHPIWLSAEQALGYRISGSISVNPGATLLALGQYLSMLAVVLLAAAIAVDRARAEWVLFALMAATALVAVVMIGHDAMGFTFLNDGGGSTGRAQARDCVALGVIVSTTAAIRTLERRETEHLRPTRSPTTFTHTFVACLIALVLCVIALTLDLTGNLLFIVTFSLSILLAVVASRRIGLDVWGGTAIAVTAGIVVVAVIGSRPAISNVDLTLAFASKQPASLISTTQHILKDVPWTGTGAGTFASLHPIYQEAGDIVADPVAPTAASNTAIALGRPMFWMTVITVMFAFFVLLRGALNRGRDSFYPAAGASSLLLLLFLSFCDNGILGMPVGICAASVIGLAFAQCTSRATSQIGDAKLRSSRHRRANGRHK
jgi:hypothetical protein